MHIVSCWLTYNHSFQLREHKKKLRIFQNLWCVHIPQGQGDGGVEPVRTFFGQGGRGQSFAILCGRFLWTASKISSFHLNCVVLCYKKIHKINQTLLHFTKKSVSYTIGNELEEPTAPRHDWRPTRCCVRPATRRVREAKAPLAAIMPPWSILNCLLFLLYLVYICPLKHLFASLPLKYFCPTMVCFLVAVMCCVWPRSGKPAIQHLQH